jgi:hypothetical protein
LDAVVGFICVRCQAGTCTGCIDVMRVVWDQKLICECPRPGHDGEPTGKRVLDPFDGSIHAPNAVIKADGTVDYIKSITCPKCKMTSHHPQDIEHMYCGNCKQFHCEIEVD